MNESSFRALTVTNIRLDPFDFIFRVFSQPTNLIVNGSGKEIKITLELLFYDWEILQNYTDAMCFEVNKIVQRFCGTDCVEIKVGLLANV